MRALLIFLSVVLTAFTCTTYAHHGEAIQHSIDGFWALFFISLSVIFSMASVWIAKYVSNHHAKTLKNTTKKQIQNSTL